MTAKYNISINDSCDRYQEQEWVEITEWFIQGVIYFGYDSVHLHGNVARSLGNYIGGVRYKPMYKITEQELLHRLNHFMNTIEMKFLEGDN